MTIKLDIRPEAASTNAELLARLAAGESLAEGSWLIVDRQPAGRGRHGHRWLDGEGNFMGSTVVRLGTGDPAPSSLSFVAALAVYGTVAGQIARPEQLQLKWPNDILLLGSKFCGILLEREGRHAVVGVGVNLAAAPPLDDRRTLSLAQVGGRPDRDTFARTLAENFDTELDRWRSYGVAPILRRWEAAAHRPGAFLSVHDERGGCVSGTYDGLAEDGALRLCLEDGSTRVIHAGEVTLEDGNLA